MGFSCNGQLATHASLRERKEFESIELEDKEEDQDEVCELTVNEFAEQTRRKD